MLWCHKANSHTDGHFPPFSCSQGVVFLSIFRFSGAVELVLTWYRLPFYVCGVGLSEGQRGNRKLQQIPGRVSRPWEDTALVGVGLSPSMRLSSSRLEGHGCLVGPSSEICGLCPMLTLGYAPCRTQRCGEQDPSQFSPLSCLLLCPSFFLHLSWKMWWEL